MRIWPLIALLITFGAALAILQPVSNAQPSAPRSALGQDIRDQKPENMPIATIAGGCFWCVESEFRVLDGIIFTRVGYIGGTLKNPTYKDITTGTTGHAEAVEITYDPKKTSYEEIIHFFLTKAHDPTQLNRQGVDVGTQYRSEIFYHTEKQKNIALRLIKQVNDDGTHNAPIVTKVSAANTFWEAEEYHQQYYEKYEEENGKVHPRVFFKKKIKLLKQQLP